MDVENGIYDMNNQSKKATFKYEKEGRFCLSVARVNILDRKITGKFCPVFNCTRGGGSLLMVTRKRYQRIYQE